MEQHWEKTAREAKERKELLKKYPLLGKKARRKGRGNKWEEGTIILDGELFIQFAENDCEQLIGLPFEIWDEAKNEWVDGWPLMPNQLI